ncbi:hypothetical protein MHYP_G00031620 [Metynnis hypsauchen]
MIFSAEPNQMEMEDETFGSFSMASHEPTHPRHTGQIKNTSSHHAELKSASPTGNRDSEHGSSLGLLRVPTGKMLPLPVPLSAYEKEQDEQEQPEQNSRRV